MSHSHAEEFNLRRRALHDKLAGHVDELRRAGHVDVLAGASRRGEVRDRFHAEDGAAQHAGRVDARHSPHLGSTG